MNDCECNSSEIESIDPSFLSEAEINEEKI